MNEVKSTIRQFVREILGVRHVSFRKNLRKIGMESLGFAELLAKTEDAFQTEIPVGELDKFKNLRAFIAYVQERVE